MDRLRKLVIDGTRVSFLAIVRVVFYHAAQVLHVDRGEELLHRQVLLFELDEELLGVTAGLRARASAHMLLHLFPLLAEHLQGLQKAEMLFTCPAARGFGRRCAALRLGQRGGRKKGLVLFRRLGTCLH